MCPPHPTPNKLSLKFALLASIATHILFCFLYFQTIYISPAPEVQHLGICNKGRLLRNLDINIGDPRAENASELVVYNRVNKCGSRTVLGIIKAMTARHNFTLYSSQVVYNRILSRQGALELTEVITKLEKPAVYERHVYWLDFEKYAKEKPVYFNLVRDPVDRAVSYYYWRRQIWAHGHINGMNFTKESFALSFDDCVHKAKDAHERYKDCLISDSSQLAYFCGQNAVCNDSMGNSEALALAKRHLVEDYLVVGYTEDMAAFFYALEALLPRFFTGATSAYYALKMELIASTKSVLRKPIKEETRRITKKYLPREYEFYEYAMQVFNNKLKDLQQITKKHGTIKRITF